MIINKPNYHKNPYILTFYTVIFANNRDGYKL